VGTIVPTKWAFDSSKRKTIKTDSFTHRFYWPKLSWEPLFPFWESLNLGHFCS